mmetsp:Transcript_28327/g.53958  ORF Transcript_28327/g.53958 Transcript_28327/m.53958 type:complete len:241 (-) Transcript_28327:1209-1931(-)
MSLCHRYPPIALEYPAKGRRQATRLQALSAHHGMFAKMCTVNTTASNVRCRFTACASVGEEAFTYVDPARVRADVTKRIVKLGNTNNPREALLAMEDMQRSGIDPDLKAVSALLGVCFKCGESELAQKVYNEMVSKGTVEPDEIIFSTMLRGYAENKPPQWKQVYGMLNNMKSKFGICPTITSFNPLLAIAVRSDDPEIAFKLIDLMAASDLVPDEKSWELVRRRKMMRLHFKKAFSEYF